MPPVSHRCALTPRRGKLFDPDVFAFPAGRGKGRPRDAAQVLPVSDGTILRVLHELMTVDGRSLSGEKTRLIVAALLPKANPDPALIKAIVRAHHWFEMLRNRSIEVIAEIAGTEGLPRTCVGSVIPFAFLAPDITAAILDGTQPVDLSLDRVMNSRDMYGRLPGCKGFDFGSGAWVGCGHVFGLSDAAFMTAGPDEVREIGV